MVLWKKLYIKAILWLGVEILLTLIGLDDLADYSEFLYGKKAETLMKTAYPTLTVDFVSSGRQRYCFIQRNYEAPLCTLLF